MKLTLIGPVHPYRGGIAQYSTFLYRALAQKHDVNFVSFAWQYPRWLFPGRSDRDASKTVLRVEADYLLTPLEPWNWWQTAQTIQAEHPMPSSAHGGTPIGRRPLVRLPDSSTGHKSLFITCVTTCYLMKINRGIVHW